ncbi:MAG: sulfatase family protein [Limisphaerales bacterium]
MDRPNVILIFLDDSGYGDYAHNGNPVIETLNISKMVYEGANFSQFYVTSPACSASRYSLLTGRYPGRSGLGSWVIGPSAQKHLHPREVTLAEGLKSRGYATGMFGKWHLGNPNEKNDFARDALPLAHGFDTWLGSNVSHDYGNAKLMKSDPKGTSPIKGYETLAINLPSDPEASTSLTGRYTDAAVEFIKTNKDRPFFAYVAHNQPHLGLYVSDKFKGRSRRGLLGDVMAEIDDSVKRIRAAVAESGVTRNTLIVFASDNGPWLLFRNTKKHAKYGEARMHVGYATPFRDGKGSTWEGGHRVPGIFCWPGVIPANQRVLHPASTLDVLPTVFALTGVERPTDRTIDGRDIRPYLIPQFKNAVAEFKFLYSYHDNGPSAIRMGPWKLHIRIGSQLRDNYGFMASRQTPLLFQVEQDISERINRHDEQTERASSMLATLENMEQAIKQEGTFWNQR